MNTPKLNPIDPRTELERRADEEAEMARMELSAPVAAQEPVAQKLIGWRTYDYLQETSDPEKALNWSSAVGVLPVFEGDPNTKLEGRSADQEQPMTPADAVHGLLAWLSGRDEVVTLSACHGATIAADLAKDFCDANGLHDFSPDYPFNINYPQPSLAQEPVAVLRYERGTPGSENEMPTVVSCNWMPDGEYRVYLGHDAAHPQPSGNAGELDERAAFEAWVVEQPGFPFAGRFLNLMWSAWQARAALAKGTSTTPTTTLLFKGVEYHIPSPVYEYFMKIDQEVVTLRKLLFYL